MHTHPSRFSFGDKVIDLTQCDKGTVTTFQGIVTAITFKEDCVVYSVLCSGGHKFMAKEGALQLKAEYIRDQTAKINAAQVTNPVEETTDA